MNDLAMNSFRNRLTFTMIIILALSVTAAGLFMAKTFKDNHINVLEDNMVREMHIILAKTEWKQGIKPRYFRISRKRPKAYGALRGLG